MDRPPTLEVFREQLLAALHECGGADVERLRTRVLRAASTQELLMERSELFQLLSRRHCESRAQLILGIASGRLPSAVGNI